MNKIKARIRKRIKKRRYALNKAKQKNGFMEKWLDISTYVWGREGRRRNRKKAFRLVWGFRE
jgi:hypothetical protein